MGIAATPTLEWPQARNPEPMTEAWFQQFLKSGCMLSAGDGRVWLGSGTPIRSAQPIDGALSLYAPDFLLESPNPWLVYEDARRAPSDEIARHLDAVPGNGAITWNPADRSAFADAFADVQARIAAGELLKAVPFVVRKAAGPLNLAHRAAALRRAVRISQGFPMMAYGFWTESDEGMIGATPELLFEQSDESLVTMALAGTRPVDSDRPSLLDDPKEMLEHKLVIDGIVARLAPIGQVATGRTSELRLPTLIHLHTPIRLDPSMPIEFQEAVAALHPTPAIGAWPIEAGWEWLRRQPSARTRGRFGAPFGVVPPGGAPARCVVAIRNVQWSPEEAAIHAGCGVVGPSKLEREWSELGSKLDAIQQALGL